MHWMTFHPLKLKVVHNRHGIMRSLYLWRPFYTKMKNEQYTNGTKCNHIHHFLAEYSHDKIQAWESTTMPTAFKRELSPPETGFIYAGAGNVVDVAPCGLVQKDIWHDMSCHQRKSVVLCHVHFPVASCSPSLSARTNSSLSGFLIFGLLHRALPWNGTSHHRRKLKSVEQQ